MKKTQITPRRRGRPACGAAVALLNRSAVRDLYDMYNLQQNRLFGIFFICLSSLKSDDKKLKNRPLARGRL